MAERLVNMFFTRQSMEKFADVIGVNYPDFDRSRFLTLVYTDNWEKKELKEKMRHTTLCLRQVLPDAFPDAVDVALILHFLRQVFGDTVKFIEFDRVVGLARLHIPLLEIHPQNPENPTRRRHHCNHHPKNVLLQAFHCISPVANRRKCIAGP